MEVVRGGLVSDQANNTEKSNLIQLHSVLCIRINVRNIASQKQTNKNTQNIRRASQQCAILLL